ncbi:MAG: deoxyribonuclease IV [Gemmatimonadota bacterium]|nr:deoxyribonuclease IV [Gemmatimonadota bacterium]
MAPRGAPRGAARALRPRRTPDPDVQLLGAHVSTAGGVEMAPARADAIGATAMQIFTKTPSQWREPVVGTASAAAFRAARAASGVRFVAAHDSYLINLASPDRALRERSLASCIAELRRCRALGLDALCSHPGNFIDDRARGLERNAAAIVRALDAVPRGPRLLLELTAGQGTVLGSTFEEMAELIARIPGRLRRRVGVCLDTAHVFAAGYDLARDYDGVWAGFDGTIGLSRLGMLHLNDSKAPLGSRRDRHEVIGKGAIGTAAFARVMRDPRLAGIPKVLETPKGADGVTNDRRAIRTLRAFARSPGREP